MQLGCHILWHMNYGRVAGVFVDKQKPSKSGLQHNETSSKPKVGQEKELSCALKQMTNVTLDFHRTRKLLLNAQRNGQRKTDKNSAMARKDFALEKENS